MVGPGLPRQAKLGRSYGSVLAKSRSRVLLTRAVRISASVPQPSGSGEGRQPENAIALHMSSAHID
jgi:hypothetical protein